MILVTVPAVSSLLSRGSSVSTIACSYEIQLQSGEATIHGDGILANILKPDILDGATTTDAVHTLALVLADDCIFQGRTFAE